VEEFFDHAPDGVRWDKKGKRRERPGTRQCLAALVKDGCGYAAARKAGAWRSPHLKRFK
jgi:hypothetical protein